MIEVIFEVGDTIKNHTYPDTYGWKESGRFIHVSKKDDDGNATLEACYLSERVICIRRVGVQASVSEIMQMQK